MNKAYLEAVHAMQSGVAAKMARGHDPTTEPKHLRVGVNSALVSNGALVKLLVAKGVITMEEYEQALTEGMQAEVKHYEAELTELYGKPITLK